MKELKEENFVEVINEYEKNVSYSDVEFTSYLKSDEFTASVKQLFYRDEYETAQEYITDQKLLFSNNEYLFFQIPVIDREYELVKGSFKLVLPDYTIIDDEHGNLYEENDEDKEVQVGNIFYGAGCIFITSSESFHNTSINIVNYIKNETIDLSFKKYVQFIERSIIIDLSEEDYLSTVNETWDGSQPLFFNKIYLYNDDYDVIAVGHISRNIPFQKNITILLDSTEVY